MSGLDFPLREMLTQTAGVKKYTRVGQEGGITYGNNKNYPCLREYVQHMVTVGEGHDLTATSRIYVGPSSSGGFPSLTPQDQITVGSSTPRILTVDRFVDESGANYIECVHCG